MNRSLLVWVAVFSFSILFAGWWINSTKKIAKTENEDFAVEIIHKPKTTNQALPSSTIKIDTVKTTGRIGQNDYPASVRLKGSVNDEIRELFTYVDLNEYSIIWHRKELADLASIATLVGEGDELEKLSSQVLAKYSKYLVACSQVPKDNDGGWVLENFPYDPDIGNGYLKVCGEPFDSEQSFRESTSILTSRAIAGDSLAELSIMQVATHSPSRLVAKDASAVDQIFDRQIKDGNHEALLLYIDYQRLDGVRQLAGLLRLNQVLKETGLESLAEEARSNSAYAVPNILDSYSSLKTSLMADLSGVEVEQAFHIAAGWHATSQTD